MTSLSPENAGDKQVGGRFRPGHSGNPRGKPRGCRNRATRLAEQLMEGEIAAVVQKVVDEAKNGNVVAAKLVLDRVCPPRRERPLNFTLPSLSSASDASRAMAAVAQAVARGELTLGEAVEVGALVETYVKTLQATEIETRLRALEERQAKCTG